MIEKALTIDGWMTESELAFLYAIGSKMPQEAQVVEIGSWKGRSTVAICEALRYKESHFYAVDTFLGDSDTASLEQGKDVAEDGVYKTFLSNTADYKYLKVIRASSLEAVRQFADGSLDWVFIDAFHEYGSVRADIEAWYPKLKVGGILSGHDYGYLDIVLALRHYFAHVCAWDTIWYTRHNGKLLNPRLMASVEMIARRVLRNERF